MKVSVYRKGHFNAAHRLHNPNWSDEKNRNVFGLCNNQNYNGHNYELEVKVTGEVNPETGYVIDMKYLADLIKIHIEDRFDHKNLNLDTVEFASLIPSAEHIVYVIYNILRQSLDENLELSENEILQGFKQQLLVARNRPLMPEGALIFRDLDENLQAAFKKQKMPAEEISSTTKAWQKYIKQKRGYFYPLLTLNLHPNQANIPSTGSG